jgi:cardiolipin synthase
VLAWRWKSGEELIPLANSVGLVLLWISALITLYTGWDYFRAGMRHLIED